ncbi:hypothetical protein ACMFMF_005599 [Clarireedia jacksonii]
MMTIMILHMVHGSIEDCMSARCMAFGARFHVNFGSVRILGIWLIRPVACFIVCYIRYYTISSRKGVIYTREAFRSPEVTIFNAIAQMYHPLFVALERKMINLRMHLSSLRAIPITGTANRRLNPTEDLY